MNDKNNLVLDINKSYSFITPKLLKKKKKYDENYLKLNN